MVSSRSVIAAGEHSSDRMTHHDVKTSRVAERVEFVLDDLKRRMCELLNAERLFCEDIGHGCTMSLGQLAGSLIAERTARQKHLKLDYTEPSWDMLLDLFYSSERGIRLAVSTLTIAGRSPSTTSLRHIAILETMDLVYRSPDWSDGRRRYVGLTPNGSRAITNYLTEIAARRGIRLLPGGFKDVLSA